MSTLKKITNLRKLPLDGNLSKEVFVDMLQSLVDWGNSTSPVFPMVTILTIKPHIIKVLTISLYRYL